MPSSKRSPPAAAANRGCINERQWSDIRRAAALAQEKGVRLTLHGVSVMPADSTHAGGSPQRATAEQAKAPRRANDDAQPPETRGGVPSEAPSKKQQRDAQRLAEHRERQRVAPILARWALLARQPLRAVRRIRRDEVWTGWRREATERKQQARRKLRDVLRPYAWQEWTRRHIEVPCTTEPRRLGACGVSRRPSGALAVVDARRVHPEARQSPLVPVLQVHRRLQANLELAAQV